MDDRRIEALAQLLEGAGGPDSVPTSAIRDMRGGRSQKEIALKSGLTQAYLSQLESGTRPLTRQVALKMADPLGVNADELVMAEEISELQRRAIEGEMDPRRILDLILELADQSDDDEATQQALDALLTVLKKSLQTYQQEFRERREEARRVAEASAEEPAEVATKSAKPQQRRDTHGRRISKPLDKRGGSND